MIQRTGKHGCPRKVISKSLLREAFKPGRNISISKFASSIKVHPKSIKCYMNLYKITHPLFSTIQDKALDSIVKQYKDSHPNTGIHYVHGSLFQQGIQVQRNWVEASLNHVDDVGRVILHNKIIKRQEYKSAHPNALWHVDGHHKLGPWGIVIHGFTDGYDRVVC